jgi:NTE family protein
MSGTSIGAIVGALYANGLSPETILDIIVKTSFFKTIRPAWTLKGLLSIDGLRDILQKYISHNNFESLAIPLTVAATEIGRGKPVYFSSGPLIPALLASSSVPVVFNPYSFNGGVYVDGGVLDNLPARVIRNQCDLLIGLHCNHVSDDYEGKNFRSVIERSLLMAINGNTSVNRGLCDIVIEPEGVGKISTFDFGRAKELYKLGYEFTRKTFNIKDFVKQ